MFQDKKYLIQLYQALHPEDTETTEDELKDITIKNILVDACYNDLGFTVGDKIMILTEAQTREAVTNTINICKDRDVLKEYLESREKEVVDRMMTLFDEEQVMRAYVESERKEAAE